MSSTHKLKPIPKFKNEDEEFEFWSNADMTEYFDFSKGQRVVFPNLKLTSQKISLRLPNIMIVELKSIAGKKDMPYQSLMKKYLSDCIKSERGILGPTKAVRKKKKTGRSASRSATD